MILVNLREFKAAVAHLPFEDRNRISDEIEQANANNDDDALLDTCAKHAIPLPLLEVQRVLQERILRMDRITISKYPTGPNAYRMERAA